MKKSSLVLTCSIVVLVSLPNSVPRADAYPTYSVNRDATNCRACHGDFRSSNYISPVDGQNWGNLHNLHRSTMLNSDCDTCHGSDTFPVVLDESVGGTGFQAIGCMGCHGRNDDMGHDVVSMGRGAGLRQHHHNSGVALCAGCHTDANPANYTPVGEDVAPPYYFTPDADHPNKPTDACNPNGEENYAGSSLGQDNDGDGSYDLADSDCAPMPGDCDGNGTVDLTDYVGFEACLLGPGGGLGGGCDCYDMDGSSDVDLGDFAAFQVAFTG